MRCLRSGSDAAWTPDGGGSRSRSAAASTSCGWTAAAGVRLFSPPTELSRISRWTVVLGRLEPAGVRTTPVRSGRCRSTQAPRRAAGRLACGRRSPDGDDRRVHRERVVPGEVGVAGHRCYGGRGMDQGGSGIDPSWSPTAGKSSSTAIAEPVALFTVRTAPAAAVTRLRRRAGKPAGAVRWRSIVHIVPGRPRSAAQYLHGVHDDWICLRRNDGEERISVTLHDDDADTSDIVRRARRTGAGWAPRHAAASGLRSTVCRTGRLLPAERARRAECSGRSRCRSVRAASHCGSSIRSAAGADGQSQRRLRARLALALGARRCPGGWHSESWV